MMFMAWLAYMRLALVTSAVLFLQAGAVRTNQGVAV